MDERTGKPTGTSFLPDDAIERGSKGNPIEKFKFKKVGTSAWTDVYDYAAKIRAGELNWEDVEKGDMDNVSVVLCVFFSSGCIIIMFTLLWNGLGPCMH